MGADNWRICPKCKRDAEDKQRRQAVVVGAAYGEVSPECFLDLVKKAGAPIELGETMGEWYELFIDEGGRFYVSYRAECEKCDFEFSHKVEQQVDL